MVVRDRLKEMQEASTYCKNSDVEELEMKTMDPEVKDFFDMMEVIVLGISDLKKHVEEIKTVQSQKYLKTKVSKKERDQHYSKLRGFVTENKVLCRKLQKLICEEKEKISKLEVEARTSSEVFLLKLRKTQIASQSEKFLEVWAEFCTLQVKFRDNMRTAFARNIDTNNNDEEIEDILENEATGCGINQEREYNQRQLSSIEIRNIEVLKLEAHIDEINSLFTDFKNLVQMQNCVVSRVEDHVNSAANDVERATAVLIRAEQYQKANNKKKIIFTAVLLILALIVLSVILLCHISSDWR